MKKITLALLALLASNSFAANNNISFDSSAKIEKTCNFKVNDFNFGELDNYVSNYLPHNIYVKCNKGTSYTINGDSRVSTNLHMTGPNNSQLPFAALTYPNNAWSTLFTTPYYQNGTGQIGSNFVDVGNGQEQTKTIYFRVYNKDFGNIGLVEPGFYSTTYTISLTY